MNFQYFLNTLPIIGVSLIGIFGVTAFIILVVYLLNKFANWLDGISAPKEGKN